MLLIIGKNEEITRNLLESGVCILLKFASIVKVKMDKKLFLLIFISSTNIVYSIPSETNTLILIDSSVIKETHSIFFQSLQDRGYKLTFKLADDPNLVLSKYGEYLYKNLIIFAPSVEQFGGDISVAKITEFIDDGGNVLITANEHSGEALRELASECGFEIDEEGAAVIDNMNFDISDKGERTTILSSANNLINSTLIIGNRNLNPIVYKGTGIITDPQNELVLGILTAESTAYSYFPEQEVKEYPHAVGRNTLLISALQARNNARVIYSGSLFFFSDKAFLMQIEYFNTNKKYQNSGNRELAIALSKWVFGETGRLRVTSVEHHKYGEKEPPQSYTIMEDVVYRITIEELINGNWRPYKANDIQVEFVRIDPFVRLTMKNIGNGIYEAIFKIPDVYGVYQFKVDYDRIGYTHIFNTTMVSVRPLQHTQYERFIRSAYPYYASAFSMMFGVFIFSFIFLYFKDDTIDSKLYDKKTQ